MKTCNCEARKRTSDIIYTPSTAPDGGPMKGGERWELLLHRLKGCSKIIYYCPFCGNRLPREDDNE